MPRYILLGREKLFPLLFASMFLTQDHVAAIDVNKKTMVDCLTNAISASIAVFEVRMDVLQSRVSAASRFDLH